MRQFLGEIKLTACDDVPEGWIKCEGQFLDIKTYPKLFMMLGTKFGQDGKFTFRLPDLREKAPAGLVYCIAAEGHLSKIEEEREEWENE